MNTKQTNESEETVVIESNAVEQQAKETKETKQETVDNIPFWKNVLVGGIPGIILGAAGSFVATDAHAAPVDDNGDTDTVGGQVSTPTPVVEDVADIAESVNDDMSFSQAFAAARAEVGPGGVFTWHGNAYSTYYAEEWNAMDADARQEYAESVNEAYGNHVPSSAHAAAAHHTEDHSANQVIDNTENAHNIDDNNNTDDNDNVIHPENDVDDDIAGEPEIHVYGVQEVDAGDGSVAYIGVAEVDGHYAEFQDLDGDGMVDQIIVDANDNEAVDDNELIDTAGAGLSVNDLMAASTMEHDMPDDDLYAGTPDYTNDADVSSLA